MPEEAQERDQLVRIMLRPLASGLPTGLFAYGVASMLTSAVGLHWIPSAEVPLTAALTLGFAVPMEWAAAVLGFLARDGTSGTSMSLYGSLWIAFGLYLLRHNFTQTIVVFGLFLLCVAAISLVLAAVAWEGKFLLAILLLISAARYLLLGLDELGLHSASKPGDVLGVVLTGIAFYGALALLIEDVHRKTILPTFRRGAARQAMEGGLDTEVKRVQHEAGVRKRQ